MFKLMMIAGAGGFIGTAGRYLVYELFNKYFVQSFPAATLCINIIGSFAIGIIYGLTEAGGISSPETRLFLATGICGGFTTFSAFSNESLTLLKNGEILYFALYIFLSVFLGILAAYAGAALIKQIYT